MNINDSKNHIEILIVEDNKADIRLIKEYFKDDLTIYHKINAVTDGVEALKYLKKEGEYKDAIRPDIILLDLHMPRMGGRETLEEIRKDHTLANLVVCVMTSTVDEALSMNIDLMPYTFYMNKPIDAEKFLELMHKAESYLPEEVRLKNK